MNIGLGQVFPPSQIGQMIPQGWKGDRLVQTYWLKTAKDYCRVAQAEGFKVQLTLANDTYPSMLNTVADAVQAYPETVDSVTAEIYHINVNASDTPEVREEKDAAMRGLVGLFGNKLVAYDSDLWDRSDCGVTRYIRLWYPKVANEVYVSALIDRMKSTPENQHLGYQQEFVYTHPEVRTEPVSMNPLRGVAERVKAGWNIEMWLQAFGSMGDDPLCGATVAQPMSISDIRYRQPRIDELWFHLVGAHFAGVTTVWYNTNSTSPYGRIPMWVNPKTRRMWAELNAAIGAYRDGIAPDTNGISRTWLQAART